MRLLNTAGYFQASCFSDYYYIYFLNWFFLVLSVALLLYIKYLHTGFIQLALSHYSMKLHCIVNTAMEESSFNSP